MAYKLDRKKQSTCSTYKVISLVCFIYFFDIDRSDAVMAWHDANLPMPYWTAQTQKNGHAHICYKLEIPLCTSEFGSQKAIAYASKVQAGLR
jgi:hypothetical protein